MPTGTILKRGQVWWAFDERIPLVILSADGMADIQAIRVVAPQAQIFKVTRSKCQLVFSKAFHAKVYCVSPSRDLVTLTVTGW